MLKCVSLKKITKNSKVKNLCCETYTNGRWCRHLQFGKVSNYFIEILIFYGFLKPKTKIFAGESTRSLPSGRVNKELGGKRGKKRK